MKAAVSTRERKVRQDAREKPQQVHQLHA